jgi:hypothetical protein
VHSGTCDITNAAPFDSEGKLKIVPYGDQTVLGNGVTYTPPAPIYDLTRDDFSATPATPPIEVVPIPSRTFGTPSPSNTEPRGMITTPTLFPIPTPRRSSSTACAKRIR